jgi:hypothetical protein
MSNRGQVLSEVTQNNQKKSYENLVPASCENLNKKGKTETKRLKKKIPAKKQPLGKGKDWNIHPMCSCHRIGAGFSSPLAVYHHLRNLYICASGANLFMLGGFLENLALIYGGKAKEPIGPD